MLWCRITHSSTRRKFINEKRVDYQCITPVGCYYTLANSQDQTFKTFAIKDGIYQQRWEKTLTQDQIQ